MRPVCVYLYFLFVKNHSLDRESTFIYNLLLSSEASARGIAQQQQFRFLADVEATTASTRLDWPNKQTHVLTYHNNLFAVDEPPRFSFPTLWPLARSSVPTRLSSSSLAPRSDLFRFLFFFSLVSFAYRTSNGIETRAAAKAI